VNRAGSASDAILAGPASLRSARSPPVVEDLPPVESPAGRQATQEIIGEAESAIWALDKALDITVGISGRYKKAEIPIPAIITEKRDLVMRLRDHWSHIDERALGKVKRQLDPRAEEAFEYASIITERA
jgi:hypothetical protein